MPVPGTQADDNRHAAFHLALNKKYYQMKSKVVLLVLIAIFFLAPICLWHRNHALLHAKGN